MSIKVMGQPIVIVNSPTIAKDLLDKRATKYSDRPRIPMIDMYVRPWHFLFISDD